MDITHFAKQRHATKAFDPALKISDETFAQIRTLLQYSPSSVNSQPWHFVVACTDEGKAKVASATAEDYSYNEAKILNASHTLVLCARTGLDDAHMSNVLEQEQQDGRFANEDGKTFQHGVRSFYYDLHRYDLKDSQHWIEKQVYLALGTLLLGASTLEVDCCPIEGFDAKKLDEALGLREQGLTAVVIVAMGYSSEEDFNAKLPKSRLPQSQVFTDI